MGRLVQVHIVSSLNPAFLGVFPAMKFSIQLLCVVFLLVALVAASPTPSAPPKAVKPVNPGPTKSNKTPKNPKVSDPEDNPAPEDPTPPESDAPYSNGPEVTIVPIGNRKSVQARTCDSWRCVVTSSRKWDLKRNKPQTANCYVKYKGL
jgi:hypothetical protein